MYTINTMLCFPAHSRDVPVPGVVDGDDAVSAQRVFRRDTVHLRLEDREEPTLLVPRTHILENADLFSFIFCLVYLVCDQFGENTV